MRKSDSGAGREAATPSPIRGKRLSPGERRASILAAALSCFARRGYAGAGTRDLARAARVTEPILYRHFAGKAGLFHAVLEQAAERLIGAVAQAVAGHTRAEERLEALARALPVLIESCGEELRILNAGALVQGEPAITVSTAAAVERIGQTLADAFKEKGLRTGVRAATAGFLLLQIGLGASMLQSLEVPGLAAEDFGQGAVKILLDGLARPGAGQP